MTDVQLIDSIGEAVTNGIKAEFERLGIAEKVKSTFDNPFKRVEHILRNYGAFQAVIQEKEQQIIDVVENGVPSKSASIMEYHSHTGVVSSLKTEEETIEAVVDALNADIVWLRQVLKRVDLALETVKDSPDYPMLEEYYFECRTREYLAEKYGTSIPTVVKRKNKLVRQITLHLFPKDMIADLMEV